MMLGDPTEVRLEDLAQVHPGGNTQRIEDDVDRRAVGEERHVLLRKDLGDHSLVPVTAGELVTLGDLALLSDEHADQLVDARRQLVAVLTRELDDTDDLALFTVRHLEGGVADLAGLLTEDR